MTERGPSWAGRAGRPVFANHGDPPPACQDHDPDLWFRKGDEQEAKAICATCPHEQACKTWAYEQPAYELYGVWGGTSRGERRNRTKRQP